MVDNLGNQYAILDLPALPSVETDYELQASVTRDYLSATVGETYARQVEELKGILKPERLKETKKEWYDKVRFKDGPIFSGVTQKGFLVFSKLPPEASSITVIMKEKSFASPMKWEFNVLREVTF
jgi:hypothetical protein